MKLSAKQRDLLLMLGSYGDIERDPMTTWELFNMAQGMKEDMEVDGHRAWNWVGWDRGGVLTAMKRLEAKGLVQRQPPTARVSIGGKVGHAFQVPSRQPARYEWALTDAGLALLDELPESLSYMSTAKSKSAAPKTPR